MRNTLFILFIVLITSGCRPNKSSTLRIACASNTQYLMEDLKKDFIKENEAEIQFVFGSSGKHTAQILNGAPYDLFISADMKYPQKIYKEDKALNKPEVYAKGKLVIWSTSLTSVSALFPEKLKSSEVRKIALPNPETAPYGKAGMEVLKNTGILEEVRNKLIFGESISQTNHYIASKAVDIGFTSKSVVLSKAENASSWESIPDSLYSPILQGAVILKQQKQKPRELNKKFYDYLFSEKARAIIQRHGYLVTR